MYTMHLKGESHISALVIPHSLGVFLKVNSLETEIITCIFSHHTYWEAKHTVLDYAFITLENSPRYIHYKKHVHCM